MSAFSATEMLAQAYGDWTKAVRADDIEAMRRAAAASKENGGPDYADVFTSREACPGEHCTTITDWRFCAWHFWRWWARPVPRNTASDCIYCGEALEFVNEFGLRGWSSTDQLDMDNNGMRCRVTDEEHEPYRADVQAVAA